MILHFREQSLLRSHFLDIIDRKMRIALLVRKMDVVTISLKNEQNRPKGSRDIASNVRSKIYFITALFVRSPLEACKKKHVRRGHVGV